MTIADFLPLASWLFNGTATATVSLRHRGDNMSFGIDFNDAWRECCVRHRRNAGVAASRLPARENLGSILERALSLLAASRQ